MEKKDKKFEEKITELETLVKALENGDVPLDEAIDYFTKATKLASLCDKDLTSISSSSIFSSNFLSFFSIINSSYFMIASLLPSFNSIFIKSSFFKSFILVIALSPILTIP